MGAAHSLLLLISRKNFLAAPSNPEIRTGPKSLEMGQTRRQGAKQRGFPVSALRAQRQGPKAV